MSDTLIRIEHLRKKYPNAVPLRDVSAEIRRGDVISVIGPSGTGKSTLLRCLNRLDEPTSGRIFFDGMEITDGKCRLDLVRRKIGMVFQSFNLFSNLTVLENVTAAPVDLMKKPKKLAEEEGLALLARVGLADRANRFPDELSGGQKQRVAIARAVAMDPEILLLDEPTSALDPTMIQEVLSVIRTLAKEGMTMMIVTHEMQFARDVSNRVFYMDGGGICEEGTPEQIFLHPVKEETRRFIRQLKTVEIEIADGEPDYPELIQKLEAFGRNAMLPPRALRHTVLAFEELVIQLIVKELARRNSGFPVRFSAEHSGLDGTVVLRAAYGGDRFDPLQEGDPLSVSILRRLAAETSYRYETENEVQIRL